MGCAISLLAFLLQIGKRGRDVSKTKQSSRCAPGASVTAVTPVTFVLPECRQSVGLAGLIRGEMKIQSSDGEGGCIGSTVGPNGALPDLCKVL